MAKVVNGAIVTEIRGKIQGSVFSRNRAGKYIQAQPRKVNKRTSSELNARNIFATFSSKWGALTEDQRTTWIIAAECTAADENFSSLKGLSGQNLYVRSNVNLNSVNESEITEPQLLAFLPGLASLSVDPDTTGGQLNVSFTPAIDVNVKIIISASPAMPPGRSSAKSKYKKITVFDSTDISPINIATEYIAVFGRLPVIGSKLFIQSKPISIISGLAGNLLQNVEIAS